MNLYEDFKSINRATNLMLTLMRLELITETDLLSAPSIYVAVKNQLMMEYLREKRKAEEESR